MIDLCVQYNQLLWGDNRIELIIDGEKFTILPLASKEFAKYKGLTYDDGERIAISCISEWPQEGSHGLMSIV